MVKKTANYRKAFDLRSVDDKKISERAALIIAPRHLKTLWIWFKTNGIYL